MRYAITGPVSIANCIAPGVEITKMIFQTESKGITVVKAFMRSRTLVGMVLGIAAALAVSNAQALEIAEWRVQTSLSTTHWDSDPEHVNRSKLINLEVETPGQWIYGLAVFDNSFGQSSQYVYAGYSWRLFRREWAYFKLSGGLLHGYRGEYEDKIPLNDFGVAPAIVPSFGVKYKRVFTELQILGTAAMTWTAGFRFGY